MADQNLPLITTPYALFLSSLSDRIKDSMVMCDPALVTVTNPATGTIRWNSGLNKFEKWSGSAWAVLSTLYAINITGNAGSASVASAVAFGNVTSKPSTLGGYGITDGAPLVSPAFTGTPTSGGSEIGYRVLPSLVYAATAAIGARGKNYKLTAAQTIPASVFAADDIFAGYNNTGAPIAITQGAGLTLRLAGTTTTGSRTLAARGNFTCWFVSATEAVISGNGLT